MDGGEGERESVCVCVGVFCEGVVEAMRDRWSLFPYHRKGPRI